MADKQTLKRRVDVVQGALTMTNQLELQDRYRGCMLGLAIGDALGAPLEFMSREEIKQRHGQLREMIGGGWLNVEPGEYTDDTQMALAIARSIAELGEIRPEDIALRFVDWYNTRPKDIGNTTRRAIEYLVAGMPWVEAGERTTREMNGRDASNGSLMRAAPVALRARADDERLVSQSLDVSRITHANPLASWSCVALNRALAALLAGEVDVIERAADVDHPEVRAAVLAAPDLEDHEVRSGGYVLHTLGAALWSDHNSDSFEEAVVTAVNLGNDTDTTGAVAGALAGARWGARAIPERWLAVLQGREELVTLADRLLELSVNGPRN